MAIVASNGWVASSRRHCSSSTPIARSTVPSSARWPASANGPTRSRLSSMSGAEAASGTRPSRSRAQRLAHLGRGHARLVVVEQRVVGVLGLGKARAVAPAQLDVALQVRREGCEVVGLARLHPGAARGHAGAGHLGHELAGHATGLVEVAPGDAHDVGLELVARRRFGEQRGDALVGEALVGQAPDGGAHLPARLTARRRHAHLLVPGHEHADALEVGDLGQALAQLVHRTRLDGRLAASRARR